MGFTYQKLKRITKNSIVLEKHENIETKQNSTEFCRKKSTFIRERFYSKSPKRPELYEHQKDKLKREIKKETADITNVLKRSLVAEKDQKDKFEKKIHATSYKLDNLEQEFRYEIGNLRKESKLLLKTHKKMEKKKNQKDKYETNGQDKTWAQHLSGNSYPPRKQDQSISISSYYQKKNVSARPPMCSVDQGAVGDHNSKLKQKQDILKECPQTDPPIIKPNDLIVNCCYGMLEQPQCHCSVFKAANGTVCHHHNYQQTGVDAKREYTYCSDEYYFDCTNYLCKPQYAPCSEAAAAISHIRRRNTDLNTQYFHCRSRDRSCSPAYRFGKNSKRKTTENMSKRKESCEEYNERKKRECEKAKEPMKKRQIGKSKETNERSTKTEKLCKLLSGKDSLDLVKILDRYIDDCSKELKLKEHKTTQISDGSSTPTTVKVRSETRSCEVTLRKKQEVPNATKDFIGCSDNTSLGSQYSIKTLHMLKKMKIREYVPVKPKEKINEFKPKSDTLYEKQQLEKVKNYEQYLQRYAKENEAKNSIEVLKEPAKILQEQKSESLDFFKQQAHRNTQYLTKVPREGDFAAATDTTSFSYERVRYFHEISPSFQAPQSYEELRFEYDKSKRGLQYNQGKIDEKYYQDFRKNVRDPKLTGDSHFKLKPVLESQKYSVKDHNGGEKVGIRGSKELKREQQEPGYHAGKSSHFLDQRQQPTEPIRDPRYYQDSIRDSLDQRNHLTKNFRENSLTEAQGQYEAEIYKESKELTAKTGEYRPYKFERKSEDNFNLHNGHTFRGTLDYKTGIYRDSKEQMQDSIEGLGEKSSGGSKYQNDESGKHEEPKGKSDRKNEKISEQYEHESNENYNSKNDNKVERSLEYQLPIVRDSKAQEPQPRENVSKENKYRQLQDFEENKLETGKLQKEAELHKRQQRLAGESLSYKKDEVPQLTRASYVKENQAEYDTKQEELAPRLSDIKTSNREHLFKYADHTEPSNAQPLKKNNENILKEAQDDVEKEFDEMDKKIHTSSYNDFKQVMDLNLGFHVHRSSQTENNFKPELNNQYSHEAFSQEKYPDQNSQIPTTTEDVLKYLKTILETYKQTGMEEKCLNSVTTAANDLITKLSSCKTLLPNSVLTSQEYFKGPRTTSEDKSTYTLAGKITQGTQYEDSESTPDCKQQVKDPNEFALLEERSKNESGVKIEECLPSTESNNQKLESPVAMKEFEPLFEKEAEPFLSTEYNKQELESLIVMKDLEVEDFDKELPTNGFFEKEQTTFPFTESNNQKFPSTESNNQEFERSVSMTESIPEELSATPSFLPTHSLTPPAEFSNEQPLNYNLTHESYMENQYLYRALPSSSGQAVFDPLKGILKLCRVVENIQEVTCDSETYSTVSDLSFGQTHDFNIQEGSQINYNLEQGGIAQQFNEDIETIISRDKSLRLVTKQSNLTPITQPIYQDCQLETESLLANDPRHNALTLCTVEMPGFKQCPCMWDTYIKMMTNYYKGKKQNIN